MSFQDLWEKYKSGNATEEERMLVEDEIEKSKLLNEYLTEELERSLINDLSSEEVPPPASDQQTKKLRRSINRKLRRVILASVFITFLILLSIRYVVSPFIDAQNYNPNKGVTATEKAYNYGQSDQFLFDLRAYTSVFIPNLRVSSAEAKPLGFGNYAIQINKTMWMEGDAQMTGIIRRGKLASLTGSLSPALNGDFFLHATYLGSNQLDEEFYQKKLADLKLLPASCWVNANLSFDQDMSMDQIWALINKYSSLDFQWIGIRNGGRTDQRLPLIGFQFPTTGAYIEKDETDFDNKKYPAFDLMTEKNIDGKLLETHFITLLRYLIDHGDFLAMALDSRPTLSEKNPLPVKIKDKLDHFFHGVNYQYDATEYCRQSLDYIKENGIKSYGVIVNGSPQEILKLLAEPNVIDLSIEDVKVSTYSK